MPRAAGGARASSATARARVTARRCRCPCSRWSTSRPSPADPRPRTASCSADSRAQTLSCWRVKHGSIVMTVCTIACVSPPHSWSCMSGVQVGILVGVVSGLHSEIIPEMAWLSLRHVTPDTLHVTRDTRLLTCGGCRSW